MKSYSRETNMQPNQKRIYISAMENHSAPDELSPAAVELIKRLSDEGFDVTWKKEWREYPMILDYIEASDALLAIVDDVWISSTWMAIEFSHALGIPAWEGRVNPHPIPTFVYRLSPSWINGMIENRSGLVNILNPDVEKAIREIKRQLSMD